MKILHVCIVTLAVFLMLTVSVYAREDIIVDIKPLYSMQNEVSFNSSDTRNHLDGYKYHDRDCFFLVYSYLDIYYPENEFPSFTLTKNISVNCSEYDSLTYEFSALIGSSDSNIATDSSLTRAYISTDGGRTYSSDYVTFTATPASGYIKPPSTKLNVYKFTSSDLIAKFGKNITITNIKLVPVASADRDGAFRLVSVRLKGENSLPDYTAPVLSEYIYKTLPDPITSGSTTNYTVYSTRFPINDGWTTNTTSFDFFPGSINQKESGKYAAFTMGYYRIVESTYDISYINDSEYVVSNLMPEPLKIITPKLDISTSGYNSLTASLRFWRVTSNEPAPTFKIYFSTDDGTTWSSNTYSVNITETSDTYYSTNGLNSSPIWEATFNILEIASGKTITNLMICPYPVSMHNSTTIKNADECFRMIDFKIEASVPSATPQNSLYTVTTYKSDYDTLVINKMINDAKKSGTNSITIPSINPKNGSNIWNITSPIILPSDITVYINNCTLLRTKYSYCNIFTVEDSYKIGVTVNDEIKNVKVIGIGNAVLDGGIPNGLNKFTVTGRGSYVPNSYTNCIIYFRNVNGFEISNLHLRQQGFWAINFIYSRNGTVENIDFARGTYIINQDGIDLRCGCNNIRINNITGFTGDDTVALTALQGWGERKLKVSGKDIDIHDVSITNITARTFSGCFIVRLLNHDTCRIYNIDINNVFDTTLEISETHSYARAAVVLGHPRYYSASITAEGDLCDVTIKNVASNSTVAAVWAYSDRVLPQHFSYDKNTISSYKSGIPEIRFENTTVPKQNVFLP